MIYNFFSKLLNSTFLIFLTLLIFILNVGQVKENEIIPFILLVVFLILSKVLNEDKLPLLKLASILSIAILIIITIDFKNVMSLFSFKTMKISIMFVVALLSINKTFTGLIHRYLGLVFLLLLSLSFILFNFGPVESTDVSRHSKNAFIIYDNLMSGNAYKFFYSLVYFDFYPNLVYILSVPFIAIFGKSHASLCLTNVLLALPVGYIYLKKISKEYFKLDDLSVSALALIVFGNLFVVFYSTVFMLDYSAICITPLIMYYFLKSNGFKNRKNTIITGVGIGMGLLIKSTFIIIAVGFIIFVLSRKIYQNYKFGKFNLLIINKILMNAFFFFVAIFVSGGWWYLVNYNHYSFAYPTITVEFGKLEGDPEPGTFNSYLYYFKAFVNYFNEPILIFIVLALMALFWIKFKKSFVLNLTFIPAIILFYFGATSTWNKDYRTIMPVMALFAPFFIGGLKFLFEKFKIFPAVIIIVVVMFIDVNFISNNYFNIPFLSITGDSRLPVTPDKFDKVEDYFVFKSLYENTFGSFKDVEILNKPDNISEFNHTFYNNVLKCNNINHTFLDKNKYIKILPLRDGIYNEHYLIGIQRHDSASIVVVALDKRTRVEGDGKIVVERIFPDNKSEISEMSMRFDGQHYKIDQNGAVKIKVSFKIVHAFPEAQLMNIYYSTFWGKKDYTWVAPLVCFHPETKENWVYLIE